MKKRIFFLIFIMFLLTSCKERVFEDKNQKYIKLISNDIPVYSDVNMNDIIEKEDSDKFVEIVSDNYKIDTNELGEKEYKLYYIVDKKKYVYKYKINIIDNEAPIVFSGTNKTVNVGYKEDLCNLITYGDNYTGDVKCEIKGDYNLEEEGKYTLSYILSDSSNNEKKVKVTLNVIKPKENKGNNNSTPTTPPPKTEFVDVMEKNQGENKFFGIDVSKWQGEIDFEKVKNAGASFVMIRIGSQSKVEGELTLDPYFKQNILNAKQNGLKVGVYLYSIATSKKEAISQANWIIKNLENEKLDLPIVFDWENWTKWNSYKLSFHEINEIANNFMTTVKNNGYDGMLYSSKFYLETIWTNKLNFNVWLAHYTDKTNYSGKYKIWQLCNNGHIDGINGDVDIDILYE